MNKDILKMNLQLFAEETQKEVEEAEEGNEDIEEEEKTYTKAELDKLLQQEGDRRVSSARSKIIKEYEEKIKEEKEEAKRLAELSAEERERELADKTQQELEETKAELRRINLESDAIDRLNEEGLPIEFKEFVIGADEESTNERIKLFKKQWDSSLEEEVNKRLKGNTPSKPASDIGSNKPMTDINEIASESRIIK